MKEHPQIERSAVESKILDFIDKDMLDQRIAQAVLDDGSTFQKDKNLLPIFTLLAERKKKGHQYWELRCIIRWLARRLKANQYLEIGVRTGWSLMQAARERPNINVIGFDLWLENYADIPNGSPSELRKFLQDFGHSGNVHFVSGDSHITLPAFLSGLQSSQNGTGSYDIVTVDGDHSIEGAIQDLELCATLVKSGGAIVFDDLIHENHGHLLDVWRAFKKAHPEFLCVENIRDYPGTGIGFRLPFPPYLSEVLQGDVEKVKTADLEVLGLTPTQLTVEQIGYQQNYFRQQKDAYEVELRRFSAELEAVQADRAAKQETIDRLMRELEGIRADRVEKQEAIDRLMRELEGIRTDRAAKQDVIDRLMKELDGIRDDRAAKQDVIDRSMRELEGVRADRASKQEVIDRLMRELEGIRTDRAAKQEVIDRLLKELDGIRADRVAKQETIDRLLKELDGIRTDDSAKRQHIEKLQGLIQAKDSAISQLGRELAEYRELGWGLASAFLRVRQNLGRLFGSAPMSRPTKILGDRIGRTGVTASNGIHVALDVIQIEFGVSGGVEIYMKTLVHALASHSKDVRITLLATSKQLPHLQDLFGDQVNYHILDRLPAVGLALNVKDAVFSSNKTSEFKSINLTFANLREALGVDIIHSPVQIFSQIDFTVPGVLNLHDLQHLHYPQNFSAGDLQARHTLYGQSAALASAIIASSNFVRTDIIENMGIPEWKVHTIQAAFNPEVEKGLETFSPEMARKRYHLPEKFGFYPAQFWLHKNHARLVEALAIVRSHTSKDDLKMVFSGYRKLSGWPVVEEAIERHNMRDHVLFLDFIPTEHLGAIYRLATFCIVPSLFEASSYPIIEAQTLGCPAMCSNIESLTELVSDGAGLVFDPTSAKDIADKMIFWLNDPSHRMMCSQRARTRALRDHSLEHYAKQVLDLYRSVKETS